MVNDNWVRIKLEENKLNILNRPKRQRKINYQTILNNY